MLHKNAPTDFPIHDLLAQRWSPRAYDASRPVSREQLMILLEAGRWSPSCNGDEPWRYLVWDRNSDAQGWQKAFDCLKPGNQAWCKNAPVLMLSCAGSVFAANGNPNRWSQHDTGMASLSIALQAVAIGLIAHQMGGFDPDKSRAVFGIPSEYTPMAMMALGYQAAPEVLEEEILKKELAPRKRRPLAESFFEGSWGDPLKR